MPRRYPPPASQLEVGRWKVIPNLIGLQMGEQYRFINHPQHHFLSLVVSTLHTYKDTPRGSDHSGNRATTPPVHLAKVSHSPPPADQILERMLNGYVCRMWVYMCGVVCEFSRDDSKAQSPLGSSFLLAV